MTCTDVIKNDAGEVTELRCTYDPETRGGASPDGRKVKGTLHWVSAAHAIDAEVRLYSPLFQDENPGAAEDFLSTLNPDSLEVLTDCKLEPMLADVTDGQVVQFERLGYFCTDPTARRMRRYSTGRWACAIPSPRRWRRANTTPAARSADRDSPTDRR